MIKVIVKLAHFCELLSLTVKKSEHVHGNFKQQNNKPSIVKKFEARIERDENKAVY